MSAAVKDITGQRFGRLTVLRRNGSTGSGAAWLCRCECGSEPTIAGSSLRCGLTQSCGCLLRETVRAPKKHGHTAHCQPSSEYRIWATMKARCENPTDKVYRHYGGRGIKVCTSWSTDFRAFLADMGSRPSRKYSLDRIDTNGNYEPKNCRWATRIEQNRNRRNNHRVTCNGITLTIAEWSERSGVSTKCIRNRLSVLGWAPERAIFEPPAMKATHKRTMDGKVVRR